MAQRGPGGGVVLGRRRAEMSGGMTVEKARRCNQSARSLARIRLVVPVCVSFERTFPLELVQAKR